MVSACFWAIVKLGQLFAVRVGVQLLFGQNRAVLARVTLVRPMKYPGLRRLFLPHRQAVEPALRQLGGTYVTDDDRKHRCQQRQR